MLNFQKEAKKTLVERFNHSSKFEGLFTTKWTWTPGFKSIEIMTIDDIPVQSYDMTKQDGSRFGPSTEVGDRTQIISVEEDWAYNATIDKRNNTTTLLKKAAGSIVARQEKRILLPKFQKFQAQRLCDERGQTRWGVNVNATGFTFTKELLEARAQLFNLGIETIGDTVCYVSASTYVNLMMDAPVVGNDKLGVKPIVNGELGQLAGFHIVEIPDEWMPRVVVGGTSYPAIYMIVKKGVAVAPKLVSTARVLTEDPDIDGSRLQYRCYHDCHVIKELANGILCAFSVAEPNDEDAFIVIPEAANTTVFGNAVSSYQSDISIFDDRVIHGKIKKFSGTLTGSGAPTLSDSPYFLALKLSGDTGSTIQTRLIGSTNQSAWTTVTSGNTAFYQLCVGGASIYDEAIEVKCTKGGVTFTKLYSLNGLHLEE